MVCSDNVSFWSACVPGNGYIEGKELENFFRELEMARRGAGVVSSGTRDKTGVHTLTIVVYSIKFICFLGPFKPHIQRKDEGVHAEVRQEQRWKN